MVNGAFVPETWTFMLVLPSNRDQFFLLATFQMKLRPCEQIFQQSTYLDPLLA